MYTNWTWLRFEYWLEFTIRKNVINADGATTDVAGVVTGAFAEVDDIPERRVGLNKWTPRR